MESLINEIHEGLMVIDQRQAEFGSTIDQGPLARKLRDKMGLLWDLHWSDTSIEETDSIRYIAFGKSTKVSEAFKHLIHNFLLIIDSRLGVKYLSQNWINYNMVKKTWDKAWDHLEKNQTK